MHTIRLRYPWTKQPHADKAVAAEPAASLRINGHPQPIGSPPLEIELSDQWALHNKIEIRLDPLEGHPVRLDGDVTLEIQTGDEAKA